MQEHRGRILLIADATLGRTRATGHGRLFMGTLDSLSDTPRNQNCRFLSFLCGDSDSMRGFDSVILRFLIAVHCVRTSVQCGNRDNSIPEPPEEKACFRNRLPLAKRTYGADSRTARKIAVSFDGTGTRKIIPRVFPAGIFQIPAAWLARALWRSAGTLENES